MPAEWFEVTITVAHEWADALANFVIESGAPGVQSDDSGSTTTIVAHFSQEPSIDSIRRFYASLTGERRIPSALHIGMRTIAAEDWAENWKLHFRPQLVGKGLYICPSWDSAVPADRIAIVIDPGMAFGTGQHATTRGCLQMLERAVSEQRCERALDVGTGSGVLAIALAKLGVDDVWAVDNDPCARAIAAQNASRNHVSERLQFASRLADVPGTFELVVANLFAGLLDEFAQSLAAVLAFSGSLICSGLLTTDEQHLRARYDCIGLTARRRHAEGDWVTLELQHRAHP